MINLIEALRLIGDTLPSAGIGLLLFGTSRTFLLLLRTWLWTRFLRRGGVSERLIEGLLVEAARRDLLTKGNSKHPPA